jgi:AcrR family transcriptional regulator
MNSEINLRDKILKAACKLIEEQGMTHFTLENIAQRANVSKGGLLYHIPSISDVAKSGSITKSIR